MLRLLALGISVALSVTVATTPAPMLWEDPGAVAERDLFNGPWGADHAPDPRATYTYLRPKHGGVNPGMIVKDDRGRTWHVKQPPHNSQGAEGPVEVVLSRVLSALGYGQPPVYFLRSFTLAGGPEGPGSKAARVETGGRFRLEEPSMTPRGEWLWKKNPFVGTRPYEGLLVILLTFNSWDLKDSNNTMYDVEQDGRTSRWFVVRDLGAALGESARLAPKRNNIDRFERQTFISGIENGFVRFPYGGWQPGLVRRAIKVDDVRWAMELLSRLTDRQWQDAFRAGGYDEALSARFIRKLQANIAEGRKL